MKEKRKLVFWEEAKVPDMEPFYRVYFGHYDKWDDALAALNDLKNAGDKNYLGIQWFSEDAMSKKDQEHPRLIVSKKLAGVRPVYSVKGKNRFVDNQDGTVTDTQTNLMWIKNGWRMDFLSALPWFEAMDILKDFKYADFSDWRLPAIEEWISLIDTNNQNPALVEPNPFVNIISHMPYWSKTEFTYGQDHICTRDCPFDSYIVTLWSGSIYHQKKSKRAFILPVRSITTQKVNKK